ncbi:MAG: hypothetical protein CL840_12255 [Crocinitomicaceae bacterium]|nr:hypothetical protein [Crocinitomicaceae bacterium]|tara:strand:+ start:1951 stop:2412 length:462 start_codon:yes stop_codon:yes gene_type:complete
MRYLFLTISSIILFTSCDTNVVFEKNVAMEDFVWNTDSVVEFEVDIQDTVNLHNMYFNLRNRKSYDFANLYVYYRSTLPNGTKDLDTLHFILAKVSGHWIGESAGELVNNQILFKRNFRFPMAGKYTFVMEQGMRNRALEGISDVGLRIERVD